MSNSQPSTSHWITLIFLSIVWGSSFILMKKGLVSFSAQQVASLRIAIAFFVFLPYSIRVFRKIPKNKLVWIACIGLFGSFIPAFLFTTAQTQLDSAPTGILNSLTPLFTYIWGISLFQQPRSLQRFLGIVIGFIGAFILIIQPGEAFQLNSFAFLIVLATMFYGLSGNLAKHFLQSVPATAISAVSFLIVGVPALIILSFTDFIQVMQTDSTSWLSLFYIAILSVVGTAIALMLFWKLIQETDAIFGSLSTYLIPIVAIIWGLLDGEKLDAYQFIGFALILFSVLLVKSELPIFAKKKTSPK